jgi:hypothetical protein
MNDTNAKPVTHAAHIFKSEDMRRGRRIGYRMQEGYARDSPDGSRLIFLHSTPLGDFDGRIILTPFGSPPPELS